MFMKRMLPEVFVEVIFLDRMTLNPKNIFGIPFS